MVPVADPRHEQPSSPFVTHIEFTRKLRGLLPGRCGPFGFAEPVEQFIGLPVENVHAHPLLRLCVFHTLHDVTRLVARL